jgi:GNAT superfamily N-acetyltransferase
MTVRPISHDDLEALRMLLAADEEHFYGRPSRIEVTDVGDWLSRTELDRDSCIVEQEGEVCAAGWTFRPAGSDVLVSIGVVHPRWGGRGLGTELVARAEASAAAHGAARIHQNTFARNAAAGALFSAHGYREVRRFYDMAIELEAPPPQPAVAVETVREGEERAFHDALEEAFRDHWEHHPGTFEEWFARQTESPNYDPSLWFLIREGDEIVAASRNEANRSGGGYVAALGVRRPWRGKGYAKALLLHTFREFYERGLRRVTLGVDAQNPTGATQLYERVGMEPELEFVVYEKGIR